MNENSVTLIHADQISKNGNILETPKNKEPWKSRLRLKQDSPAFEDNSVNKQPPEEKSSVIDERSSKQNKAAPPAENDSLGNQPHGDQTLSSKPSSKIKSSLNMSPKEKQPSPISSEIISNAKKRPNIMNLNESNENSDDENQSNIWSCDDCTFHNPLDASQCGICGCEAGGFYWEL